MPNDATIDSSSISFSHLRTQWDKAGFHRVGSGDNPGSSNIKLSEFGGAVTGFKNGSVTENVPTTGELSIDNDFKGKTFFSS